MTTIDIKRAAEDRVFRVAYQINKFTKRGKDVPAELLIQFGIAWADKEAALNELLRAVGQL